MASTPSPNGPAAAAKERKPLIPPHILWPAFVVGLLVLGMANAISLVRISKIGGGPAVVEDYYAQAVNWDKQQAAQAASDALGWTTTARLVPAATADGARTLELTITDRAGQPVEGLAGIVRAYRPEFAEALLSVPLTAKPGAPGVYAQPLAIRHSGLWDVTLEAHADGQETPLLFRQRLDVR